MIQIPPSTAVCKARNGVGPEPTTAQASQSVFPIPAIALTSRRRILFKILFGGFRPVAPQINFQFNFRQIIKIEATNDDVRSQQ